MAPPSGVSRKLISSSGAQPAREAAICFIGMIFCITKLLQYVGFQLSAISYQFPRSPTPRGDWRGGICAEVQRRCPAGPSTAASPSLRAGTTRRAQSSLPVKPNDGRGSAIAPTDYSRQGEVGPGSVDGDYAGGGAVEHAGEDEDVIGPDPHRCGEGDGGLAVLLSLAQGCGEMSCIEGDGDGCPGGGNRIGGEGDSCPDREKRNR